LAICALPAKRVSGWGIASPKDINMSAYIVIEGIDRDNEAIARYRSLAAPMIKQFKGEILAFGTWQVIHGEATHHNGTIIRFPDTDRALAWYNAPANWALLKIGNATLDCRFRLLG
jgi:uncharacterized protein (DUF1330 family)